MMSLSWLWPALGWTFSALAAGVVAWALVGRRPAGPHCRKCGYGMDHAMAAAATGRDIPACPECRFAAKREKDLYRRVRAWRRVWWCVPLLVLAYLGAATPRMAARGWMGAVPTPVLLLAVPWESPDPDRWLKWGWWDPVQREIEERRTEGDLDGWKANIWVARTWVEFALAERAGVSAEEAALIDRLSTTRVDRLEGMTVAEIIATATKAAGAEVEYDRLALDKIAFDAEKTVSELEAASAAEAIEEACAIGATDRMMTPVTWTVRGGRVVVTPRPASRRFDAVRVGDTLRQRSEGSPLRTLEERLADLGNLVTGAVDSPSWIENGGVEANLIGLGGWLLVTNSVRNLHEVEHLLDAAREAERHPAAVGVRQRDFEIARQLLEHIGPERPVQSVASDLGIPCIATAGSPWSIENGVVVNDHPRSRMLCWHGLRGSLPSGASVDKDFDNLINLLTSVIEPEGWMWNGGEQGLVIGWGQTLLVSTSAPVQVRVDQLLKSLGSASREKAPTQFTPAYVDRSEPAWQAYNIKDLILAILESTSASPSEARDQIAKRMVQTVDAEGWQENGGDRSSLHAFREHVLVVVAPSETQVRVQRFLDECLTRGAVLPAPIP